MKWRNECSNEVWPWEGPLGCSDTESREGDSYESETIIHSTSATLSTTLGLKSGGVLAMRAPGGEMERSSTNTSCGWRRASRVHFRRWRGGRCASKMLYSFPASELQNLHLAHANSSSTSAAQISNKEGNIGSNCAPFISTLACAPRSSYTHSPSNSGSQYSHQVRAVENSSIISSRS